MTKHALTLALAIATSAAALGAQTPAFTYERTITVDGAGTHHLDLDVAVLVGSDPFRVTSSTMALGAFVAVDGLRDLRLYDADARELPYLLVYAPRRVQPRAAARPIAIVPAKITSGFEVDLGAARSVDLLQVLGLPAPFLKRVRLDGSGDRLHWTMLVSQSTLFDLPNERLRQLELEFAPGDYRYLRVTWDDSSSARMPLPATVYVRSAASLSPARPPLIVPAAFERRGSEPGKSRYAVRLPGAHLPIVALRLIVSDSNVLRDARVTEARLTGMEVTPVVLGTATLRRAARDGAVASQLEIRITPPAEDRVELAIDDANNPPLAITGVEAVFAELPYVFFQTRGAGTLSARYGAPSLAAPRYDLEALRDSANTLKFTSAHWGAVARLRPLEAAGEAAGIPAVGAPVDVTAFRWSRAIVDTSAGLATLRLDDAVLAHSRLTDVRIVDASGRQVPYLLEHLDGPLTDSLKPLELLPRTDTLMGGRTTTHYRLHLPYDSLPEARLVLRTPARVFERRVRIEVPGPENSRRERYARTVADASWAHADPDTPAPALIVNLPPIARDSAEVVIDEGDNTPLPLGAPILLLPGYQLRFQTNGKQELRLVYGRRDLTPPRYDIALLAPRLIGVPATEVTALSEGAARDTPTNALPGRIFWGVLIAAVLVLLAIVVKLVKGGAPAEAKGAGQ